MDKLGDIYLIYPKKPLSRNHFIAESVWAYDELLSFNGGRFELGLYKCQKRKKLMLWTWCPPSTKAKKITPLRQFTKKTTKLNRPEKTGRI